MHQPKKDRTPWFIRPPKELRRPTPWVKKRARISGCRREASFPSAVSRRSAKVLMALLPLGQIFERRTQRRIAERVAGPSKLARQHARAVDDHRRHFAQARS